MATVTAKHDVMMLRNQMEMVTAVTDREIPVDVVTEIENEGNVIELVATGIRVTEVVVSEMMGVNAETTIAVAAVEVVKDTMMFHVCAKIVFILALVRSKASQRIN